MRINVTFSWVFFSLLPTELFAKKIIMRWINCKGIMHLATFARDDPTWIYSILGTSIDFKLKTC